MRIIGGQHRGLTLANVGKGDTAAHLRPTSDRVRESLFNILAGYDLPEGVHVLDLFAGTGALGLEALSRGATFATFVDTGRTAQSLIRENLRKSRRTGDATLLTCSADRLPKAPHACDLMFIDPPYGQNRAAPALKAAQAAGWLSDQAIIICEDNAPQAVPGFMQIDLRRYGDTSVTFLKAM